jgi:hypothetical protein
MHSLPHNAKVSGGFCFRGVMKADLRISVMDYRRNKNLKVLLFRPPFPSRGFMVRMNGQTWPKHGRPVCLTRVLAALRKSLVKASAPGAEVWGCGVWVEEQRPECAAVRRGEAEKFFRSHRIHESRAARFLQA